MRKMLLAALAALILSTGAASACGGFDHPQPGQGPQSPQQGPPPQGFRFPPPPAAPQPQDPPKVVIINGQMVWNPALPAPPTVAARPHERAASVRAGVASNQ